MKNIGKKGTKLLTMLVVLTMIFSLFPAAGVFAADAEDVIIRVIGLDGSGDMEYWVEPTEITVPDGGISAGGVLGLTDDYDGMPDATVLNAMKYVADNWASINKDGVSDTLGACETRIGDDGLSAYIAEFHDLGEFDEGVNSGWMFFVNDEFAGEGLGEYELEDYDVVTLFYVKDFTTAMYTYFDKATLTMTNNKIVAQTESGDGAEVPLKVMGQSLNFSDLYAVKLNVSSGASLYEAGGTLSGSVAYDQGYVLADINESISTSTAAGVKAAYSGAVQYIPAYYPFATADYQYDTLNDADTARDAIVAAHSTAYPSANYESGSYAILTDAYTELDAAGTIPTIIGAMKYYNRAAADLIGANDARVNRFKVSNGYELSPAFSPDVFEYDYSSGWLTSETYTLGFINPNAEITDADMTGGTGGSINHTTTTVTPVFVEGQYVITITVEVGTGSEDYVLNIFKPSSDGLPSEVIGYLVAPSQYAKGTSFGSISSDDANTLTPTPPEYVKTLADGDLVSIGGFGGYIVYEYSTPITNSANNPYGVDLIVYGNAFVSGSGTWAEPGIVQVAEKVNGEPGEWYTIAGSEHFSATSEPVPQIYWKMNGTTVRYSFDDGSSWTDFKTNADEWWPEYAAPENYGATSNHGDFTSHVPMFDSDDLKFANLVKLADNVTYQFGYCDVHANGTNLRAAANPYTATYQTAAGDGIDLEWAIDEDGDPVNMSEKNIYYVRIYTGVLENAGAFGEVSTELTAVTAAEPAESGVNRTGGPTTLTVGGVDHKSDLTVGAIPTTPIYIPEDTPTTVSVTATSGYAVFVNNAKGTTTASQDYTLGDGEQQVVRVIVQNGTEQPYIAYLLLQGASS